jgi:GH24 family phage-related lysozyme (muramidase)
MAKHYRFKRSLLNGHPGNINRACKRVIVRAANHGLVVTSTTDGSHSPTSFHFTTPGRAVDLGHGPGVSWDEGTRRKIAFQKWLLRRGPGRYDELFGPDNTANVKNGQRFTLGEGTPLENLHDTHVHVAPRSLLRLPRRPKPFRKPPGQCELSMGGLDLIAGFEGFVDHPYKPVPSEVHWTWGFGHFGPDVPAPGSGRTITREQAMRLLKRDTRQAQGAIRRLVKVPLSAGEFDALTSFVVNVGEGAFAASTLLRLLNQRKRKSAAAQFARWTRDGTGRVLLGLVRRRAKEARLFMSKRK